LQALADDAEGYLVKPFRSLSHAVEQIQGILDADLVERRKGPPLARRVAGALMGLPEDLNGVAVCGLGGVKPGGVVEAGGTFVEVFDVDDADVVVGADLAELVALGRARQKKQRSLGLVLLETGATFQEIAEFISVGGGALVDRRLIVAGP
jgi:hypothetical protein